MKVNIPVQYKHLQILHDFWHHKGYVTGVLAPSGPVH